MIEGNISITLDDFTLSTGDFKIKNEAITVIYGDSGCGKSTLLNCIAGLEKEYTGDIKFKNNPVIGYVFQSNSLFPHLNVKENLSYAFKRCLNSHYSIEEIIDDLSLTNLLDKSVELLSGGEVQRVTIARTLLSSPDILLLDEPLSALHTKAKEEILNLILRINKKFKLPIVVVTHSMKELVSLCDDVILMKKNSSLKMMTKDNALFQLDQNGPINYISNENIKKLKLKIPNGLFDHLVIHSSNIIPTVDLSLSILSANSIECRLVSITHFSDDYLILKLQYLETDFLYCKICSNIDRPNVGQKLWALFGPDSHII